MADEPKDDAAPETFTPIEARGAAPPVLQGEKPVKAAPVLEAAAQRTTYLTAWSSEEFGPQGRFVDVTADEWASADPGLLIEPTEDQLARRR